MLVKSFGRINDLFSLTDVQCMCKQKLLRILVVQVSWTALQSQFMEQYFSISQFTDTRNGHSRCHKNKSSPPPSVVLLTPTHYINPSLTEMLLRLHDSFPVLSVSSIIACIFLRWRKKILRTHEWRKGKGATAAETLAFNLCLQCINVTALHQLTKNDWKQII